MRDPGEKWQRDLERWCEPYLDAFEHKVRRRWAPVYLRGLLLPGDRKSIEPIVERVAPAEKEQIHHFVATSKWDTQPIEAVHACARLCPSKKWRSSARGWAQPRRAVRSPLAAPTTAPHHRSPLAASSAHRHARVCLARCGPGAPRSRA